MNTKSSPDASSESLLARGASRVRYLGLRAIPGLVLYQVLSQLFHYRATSCVWADLKNWHPISRKAVPFEVRPLSAEEIKGQAERMGESPEDVDQALGSGAEVLGAMDGRSIVSFLWISSIPPALDGGYALEFDQRLAFFYRAFTLPGFRGLGLMPALLQSALERCATRGDHGAVACIDVANRPSRIAFRSAGFKKIATFRYAKILGRDWIHPLTGEEIPRFRFRRRGENSGSDASSGE